MKASKFKILIEDKKVGNSEVLTRDTFTYHDYILNIKNRVYSKEIVRTQKPLEIFLELTNKCNLNCVYCYKKVNGADDSTNMSLEMVTIVIDYLNTQPSTIVCLEGGEPLLHPHFIEIFYKLKESKIPVDILTNGLLFDFEMVKQVASVYNSEYDSIQISLDGIGELNKSNRGGDVNKILSGINILNEFKIKPRINCVVTNQNYQGIVDMIQYLDKNYKISSLSLNSPIGQSVKHYVLDDVRAKNLYDEIENVKGKFNLKILGTPIKSEKDCDQNHGSSSCTHIRCTAMRSKLCISTNGDVYPCVFLEKRIRPLGNLVKEGFEEIWNSKKANDYVSTMIEKTSKCSSCKVGKYCPQTCAGELI